MRMPDQAIIPTRPGTLAEVVRRVRDDREALHFCLAGFLDEFYADRLPAGRRARIDADPGLFGDQRHDALIGAIGEHLCHRWGLGEPPAWTHDPARFLEISEELRRQTVHPRCVARDEGVERQSIPACRTPHELHVGQPFVDPGGAPLPRVLTGLCCGRLHGAVRVVK